MTRTILVRTMHADDPRKDCWREVELETDRPLPRAEPEPSRPAPDAPARPAPAGVVRG